MTHRKMALASTVLLFVVFGSAWAGPSADKLLQESGVSGGIAVHVGCGDGTFTAALHDSDRLLVHGLDTDAADVEKAKSHIDSLGLRGKVWAERYDGKNLPHGDNVVNLLVIEDASALTAQEIARVLVPKGVAFAKAGGLRLESSGLKKTGELGGWIEYTKPWPVDIDEWTHFLHDASGNAVSKDKKVGHPRHLQWYAGPKHTRDHDALASLSAMTSSGGRLFYIFDEGPISLIHRPPSWKLIARDAFNGKLLWKRDIPDWMTHLYNFRAGPKQLPRRLVSVGDTVYATLGFTAPVTKLDAATGKTLSTYSGSENTEELIVHDGMLLTVKGDPSILIDKADGCHGYWELAEHEDPTVAKSISAYDAATGKVLWTVEGDNLKYLTPLSLCAEGNKVFYLDNKQLHCLDAKTGEELWAAPFETEGLFIRSYAPTVTVHDDVILVLKWNRLCGYSVETGKRLWENKGSIGFGSPGDLFAIGDKVWTNPMRMAIWRESRRNKDGIIVTGISIPRTEFLNEAQTGVGIDIHTGKITDVLPFAHNQHHHRCYRDKATERYLLIGHSGIQLVDIKTKKEAVNQWVRGVCQYGIMPANGYIYVPPDPCACYNNAKINGFFALSERNSMEDIEIAPSLEKGPAYARVSARQKAEEAPEAEGGWPTYRGNISRSGSTAREVSGTLNTRWEAEIGGDITAPVIAGNRVYVAEKNACTIYCLDRNTGKTVWKSPANGPIDSPPTLYAGLCVFGCRDGSVYCLDAASGELAWRFKTAGIERRVGSEDRLESPLAVSGSVLVMDGVVYFAAGRSSYLDGGIRVYGLDVRTGKQLYSRVVSSGYWGEDAPADEDKGKRRGKGKRPRRRIGGALADILVSDGATITMRYTHMDKTLHPANPGKTICSSTGLLDPTWFHRQTWRFERMPGHLLVYDDHACYGVVNPYHGLKQRRKGKFKEFHQDGHLHQKFSRYEESFFPVGSKISAKGRRKKGGGIKPWSIEEPFQPRAMVLAGENLYLAGWLDSVVVEPKTGRPKSQDRSDLRAPELRVYSARTGDRICEHKLPSPPVFDGVASAYGDLFISLENGKLVCMGG